MKKTIFLISFIALAMISMAQKGSWYVGGQVGYSFETDKPEDADLDKTGTTTWNVSPEFGTFITNSLQLGFVGGFSGEAQKEGDNKVYSILDITPTIYVRNFYKFTDNLSAFAGLYFHYNNGIDKNYTYNTDGTEVEVQTTHMGFGTSLGLGLAYALSPRFTVLGQYGLFGFSTVGYKNNEDEKTNHVTNAEFGVNTVGSGTAFNVGVYYTFKK